MGRVMVSLGDCFGMPSVRTVELESASSEVSLSCWEARSHALTMLDSQSEHATASRSRRYRRQQRRLATASREARSRWWPHKQCKQVIAYNKERVISRGAPCISMQGLDPLRHMEAHGGTADGPNMAGEGSRARRRAAMPAMPAMPTTAARLDTRARCQLGGWNERHQRCE